MLSISALFLAAACAAPISGPMVVSDAWPRATDLATWANDVLRLEGKTAASDRDQALALYYWTRLFVMSPSSGTEPYEGPFGQERRLVSNVTRVMFVHGCGDCDYQARALEAVWAAYKRDDRAARRITLTAEAHTMVELFWDRAWHAFDPLNGVFFIESDSPTANVLSFAQEANSEALLRANEGFQHRARPFFERVRSWDQPSEWRTHLNITGAYDDHAAWEAAGSPGYAVYGTHSNPSLTAMHDMRWRLPRGTTVERRWSADPVFYRPQITGARFRVLGRHYRQAVEWGPAETHWNAEEDLYNFPKVEPYLRLCTDPNDSNFYDRHTLYLVGSGTITYDADLWTDSHLDAVEGTPTLVRAQTPPYLRPAAKGTTSSITFRVRTPYIVADATLSAAVHRGPGDRARFLLSTDGGTRWEEVAAGSGPLEANLGVSRHDGSHQSVCGAYDYLVRFECEAASDPSSVGLDRLRIVTRIDGSLNALPRLREGRNTVRVQVDDAAGVRGRVRVGYRWLAGGAEHVQSRTFTPADFSGNEASFSFDAPGLTRCASYEFSYGGNDEDDNGLPDSWERLHFGATGQDPAADPDEDGIANADAYHRGIRPSDELHPQAVVDAEPDLPAEDPAPPGESGSPADASQRRGCGCQEASSLLILPALLAWAIRTRRRAHRRPVA